jgi:hypothetical protein
MIPELVRKWYNSIMMMMMMMMMMMIAMVIYVLNLKYKRYLKVGK